MKVKITDKILSIPPYVSTTWSRISALHMKGNMLAITLSDGDTIQIPNLDSETINLIFQNHASYVEKESTHTHPAELAKLENIMNSGENSIRVAFGSSLDGLGTMMMQHNPNQSDSPDLPPEILQKISAIAKIMGPSDELLLPKPESGCNCFHCQIARALQSKDSENEHSNEELVVKDEELQFQQWSIQQTGDKLFLVVNRLDEHEKYNVFLGQPIGCTCGKTGCEHILAVLKS